MFPSKSVGVVVLAKEGSLLLYFDLKVSWRKQLLFASVTETVQLQNIHDTSSFTQSLFEAWTLAAIDTYSFRRLRCVPNLQRTASSAQQNPVTTAVLLHPSNVFCITADIFLHIVAQGFTPSLTAQHTVLSIGEVCMAPRA